MIGDGGAEHLPQPSPMGLILATQRRVQCRRVLQAAGHQILIAWRSCRCPELGLPLALQPRKTKEARSCTSHKHASMSKLANKTSTVQNVPLRLVWWHSGTPPPSTRGATRTAAALSHLLFRLALGCRAGEDTAGAQQRAGGLPAADVCHQRGTSAGN